MRGIDIPPQISPETVFKTIGNFLDMELRKTGRDIYVVGLSGGVDSALSAALAVRALGREKLLAVKIPYRSSNPLSEHHADLLIEKFGMKSSRHDITFLVDDYFKDDAEADRTRRGNFMARQRMAVLFDLSAKTNGLVLGTSNKSEILMGYTTWHGDSASSLNPIADLYKTQVFQMARFMEIPEEILSKPPSADLWPGQTDEQEMGISYSEADPILYLMVDKRYTMEETAGKLGISIQTVRKVFDRVRKNQFKRRLPISAKISFRTVGIDFRYPRDWGR